MGNGFNYIREIMQMNLPDTPVEKTIKAATDGSMEGFSRYQFIGYMADSDFLLSNDPKVVVRINKCDRGKFQARAHAGDVIMHRNKLYAWCERIESFANDKNKLLRVGMWLEFNPGPCTSYDGPRPENKEVKEDMAKHNLFDDNEHRLSYIGRSTTEITNGSTAARLRVEGTWIYSKAGYIVMYDDRLYVCAPDGKWYDITAAKASIASNKTNYNKIPYGFLAIKNVVFNDPATIVMWQDGSKTVVKCGENEEFDWEKGLAMAVAKKAFGNQGNYFNQIKKWKPESEENGDEPLTLKESLNRIFGDPKIEDAKKKLAAVQELICDMALRGATKAELMRAIRFSKDLIDVTKGGDLDIDKSVEALGIIELEAKYQPEK